MRRKRTGRPVPQHVRERSALRRARLRKLGYESYSAYLSSPHWRSLKARYRASDLPQRCMCGERSVHFHHKTYERLGAELLTDLTPLCRVCHDLIHLVDRNDALGLDFDRLRDPAHTPEIDGTDRRRLEPSIWATLRGVVHRGGLTTDASLNAKHIEELHRNGLITQRRARKGRMAWQPTDAGRSALHAERK
jgi:5-methylcytosine-specific restriction endonuclease McrA